MNIFFLAAAGLAVVVGLVHSILGEVMIFRRIPRDPAALMAGGLRQRNVNILWATWHIVTVFGCGIAALLFGLAQEPPTVFGRNAAFGVVCVTAIAAAFVLFATRGRHPGWAGLAGIAVLTLAGLS
jgi:hypothetical protein